MALTNFSRISHKFVVSDFACLPFSDGYYTVRSGQFPNLAWVDGQLQGSFWFSLNLTFDFANQLVLVSLFCDFTRGVFETGPCRDPNRSINSFSVALLKDDFDGFTRKFHVPGPGVFDFHLATYPLSQLKQTPNLARFLCVVAPLNPGDKVDISGSEFALFAADAFVDEVITYPKLFAKEKQVHTLTAHAEKIEAKRREKALEKIRKIKDKDTRRQKERVFIYAYSNMSLQEATDWVFANNYR